MRAFFMETERVGFSRWEGGDLPLARMLWGDARVTEHISAAGVFSEEEIAARLEREMENGARLGFQYWPVFLLESMDFAGCCGLRPHGGEAGVLELGVHLRSRYWGRGLATECAGAVIDYAFTTLRAPVLFSGHGPDNQGSARVLKKAGFRYTHDELYPPTGRYHPSYRLTRREYEGAVRPPGGLLRSGQ